MWTAWEPDPSERCVGYWRGRRRLSTGKRLFVPRRFKTAEAAMKVVDKLFPLADTKKSLDDELGQPDGTLVVDFEMAGGQFMAVSAGKVR